MEYKIESWTISKLLKCFEDGKLNLNPPYQRNDIWPPISKKRLIESIKLGYPLPSFFLHDKGQNNFDMVDGQQRTRTFLGYRKKLFPDLVKKFFDDADQKLFDNYSLSVTIITPSPKEAENIEDFYFRVNKFGVKLNRPEIKRAEFSESPLQNLIESLAVSEKFLSLELFTQKSSDRLTDLDFLSELLALVRFGITDKKIAADRLYNDSLSQEQADGLEQQFNSTLDPIIKLNKFYSIEETRYKQRNDFYTLFSFLLKHKASLTPEVMLHQYKILILIGDDISPSNDKCWPLQDYANNCVSQSNSKKAREQRLIFFERLLLNKESNPLAFIEDENSEFNTLADILKYYQLDNSALIQMDEYHLIDTAKLNAVKTQIQFL